MSMYNPNVSIPKTLVKFLVRVGRGARVRRRDAGETLLDVVATEISPELLPDRRDGQDRAGDGERRIGPYELVDFFLYHFLRLGRGAGEDPVPGASSAKFDEAVHAGRGAAAGCGCSCTRFFANQFKRSCLPDGPKVGSVSLSPRGDWRMPSATPPPASGSTSWNRRAAIDGLQREWRPGPEESGVRQRPGRWLIHRLSPAILVGVDHFCHSNPVLP